MAVSENQTRSCERSLQGLPRYIATVETSRRRFFVFLDAAILPDNKLVNIALDDAYFLGVLSSRIHVSLGAGRRRSPRRRQRSGLHQNRAASRTFPFPDATDAQKARIRGLAEELDAHRKRQQAQHPKLTLTDMYNVLEKLRAGEPLPEGREGPTSRGWSVVLRQLHDELDAAVFDAYGWPATLTDEEILARLVALNAERAAEEAQGLVRWLRPEYQAPSAVATGPVVTESGLAPEEEPEPESAPAEQAFVAASGCAAPVAGGAGRAGGRGARCAGGVGPAGDGGRGRGHVHGCTGRADCGVAGCARRARAGAGG